MSNIRIVMAMLLVAGCAGHSSPAPEPSVDLNAPVLLAARGGDSVVPESLATIRPKPIVHRGPRYPFDLKNNGVDGVVTVGMIVSSAGVPDSASMLIISSTNDELSRSVLDFVHTLRFRPGFLSGRRVAVRITQKVAFHSMSNQ